MVSPCIHLTSRREVEIKERAILRYKLAVGVDLPVIAQVADQIPVHARVVLPAGLLLGAPDRQVHRAAELLVEEDVLGRPAYAVVGPDAELAQVSRPLVRAEHGLEELIPLLGARLDYPALHKAQPHPQDLAPRHGHRDAEVDLPVRRVLDRTGEDLSARHVVPAVAVHEGSPLDGERKVGPLPDDSHLPGPLEPIYEPLLL